MRTLSIAGTQLDAYHICAFFDSREQEYAVLTPFYQDAAANSERNLHFVAPALVEDHKARLRDAGMNTHQCEACGQLEVLDWHQSYIDENGVFDKDKMLAAVDRLTQAAGTDGFSGVRIMGNMAWVFDDVPGSEDIIRYEAEVNEVLERNRQPAVCVYDIAQLTGSMMMDLLRTHPITLINGVLQENPYYTPPPQMMEEMRRRTAG